MPLVKAKLKGQVLIGLLDLGSSVNCVHKSFVNLCDDFNADDKTTIRVFNGQVYTTNGTVSCNFNFGPLNINAKRVLVVSEFSYDFLLGIDNISALSYEKSIDGSPTIYLNNKRLNVDFDSGTFFSCVNTEIAPGTSATIDVKGPRQRSDSVFIQGLQSDHKHFKGIYVCDTASNSPKVTVINPTPFPIEIPKNFPLGQTFDQPELNMLESVPDKTAENIRHAEFLRKREIKLNPKNDQM